MTNLSIYILKCVKNKYYIGRTNRDAIDRISEHFEGNGAYWTKKYKPIKVISIYNDCDEFDEDKYTKKYMKRFGIDNVRGGSYCKISIDEETKKLIQKEILTADNKCFNCGEKGHFVNNCPKVEYPEYSEDWWEGIL